MSTTSVLNLTHCFLNDNSTNTIVEMGQAYMLRNRFMIGCGVDIEKFKKIKRLNKILKIKECLLDEDRNVIKQALNKLTY